MYEKKMRVAAAAPIIGLMLAATASMAAEPLELPQPASDGTVVTLAGEAARKLANDEATVIFSVEIQKSNVAAATEGTVRAVNTATENLKRFDGSVVLQTAEFSTRPVYKKAKEGETPEPGAWVVRQTLRVKVSDLTKLSDVMNVGLQTMTIDGIEMRVSDELRKKTQDELLTEAVHDAMERAVRVAASIGAKPEDVRIESIGTGRISMPSARYYAAPRMNDAVLTKAALSAPVVSAGMSDVTQEVTMQVRIRP